MDTESNIDKKYREQLLEYYFRNPILKGSTKYTKWVSPCPFCSSSRKTESKRNEKVSALIWVDDWNTWTFTCRRMACPHPKLSFPRLIEALNRRCIRSIRRKGIMLDQQDGKRIVQVPVIRWFRYQPRIKVSNQNRRIQDRRALDSLDPKAIRRTPMLLERRGDPLTLKMLRINPSRAFEPSHWVWHRS